MPEKQANKQFQTKLGIHIQHLTQLRKIESFPKRIRNIPKMTSFITAIDHCPGYTSHNNQAKKKKKNRIGTQVGKEEVKLWVLADDMIYM